MHVLICQPGVSSNTTELFNNPLSLQHNQVQPHCSAPHRQNIPHRTAKQKAALSHLVNAPSPSAPQDSQPQPRPPLCQLGADRHEGMGGSLPNPTDGRLPHSRVSKGSFLPLILDMQGVSYLFVGHCDWEQLDPTTLKQTLINSTTARNFWSLSSSQQPTACECPLGQLAEHTWTSPTLYYGWFLFGFVVSGCMNVNFPHSGQDTNLFRLSLPVMSWVYQLEPPDFHPQGAATTSPCKPNPTHHLQSSSILQLNKYQHKQKSWGQENRLHTFPAPQLPSIPYTTHPNIPKFPLALDIQPKVSFPTTLPEAKQYTASTQYLPNYNETN